MTEALTYTEAIKRYKQLKAENEDLKKDCKLLYQSLEEIKELNDAILSDADDTLYLSGFIDAKASAIDTVVGDRYKDDSDDR